MIIKPSMGEFRQDLVADEWRWFHQHQSLCILFNEGSTKPFALDNGVYKDIITVTEGTTLGTSTAKLDGGRTGIRADFKGNDGSGLGGGGEWAYHIANGDLPDWFPGTNGNENKPFTCLLLAEPEVVDPGNAHVVLQRNATTGSPLFVFFRETIRCNLATGEGTAFSDGTLTVGLEEMTGCVFDGSTQYVIQNAKRGTGVNITGITGIFGDLNIGTRTDTIDTVNSRLNGSISGIIFINVALDGGNLQQLDNDFFGPFRQARPTSFFAASPITRPRTTQGTIGINMGRSS